MIWMKRLFPSAKALTTKQDLSIGIPAALEQLPRSSLSEVALVSLSSTTLATNACVEDRGGRLNSFFIGGDRNIVAQTGDRYGLPSAEELYFLNGSVNARGRGGAGARLGFVPPGLCFLSKRL